MEREYGDESRIESIGYFYIFLFLAMILIAGGVVFFLKMPDEIIAQENIEFRTVTRTIPLNISFSDYINNRDKYDQKEVSLVGFLQRDLVGNEAATYFQYIVDDMGNKIKLEWLDSSQIAMFPKTGKTSELYNVTGLFNRRYLGSRFGVASIQKTERPVVEIKENITVMLQPEPS